MAIPTIYLLLMFTCKAVFGSSLSFTDPPILEFSKEPPGQVDFSNNTGTRIECHTMVPSFITWVFVDGTHVTNVTGLRTLNFDGSLTFAAFNSEAFRQDVHSTTYRCVASSTSSGTLISRDVRVRAVMEVDYDSAVYDVFAIRGNTAVIKCHIPTFLQDYVTIVAYIRDDSLKIATPVDLDGKYSLSPSGALYIKDVGTGDAGSSYRCQTLPRLSGHMKTSSVVGRLFVNEPQGNVPPKIADRLAKVDVREGEVAVLPCVARGYPTPITQWYIRSVVGDLLLNNQNGVRREVANGLVFTKVQLSDSGTYLCRANNSVGSDQAEILLTVSAPLHVEMKVKSQTVEIGGSVSLECNVSGFPVSSVWWLKNGRTMESRGSSQTGREVLRVESVSLEDKGTYQCFARNDREVVQDVSEVRLGEFAPVLLKKFATTTLDPGSAASLSCEATGNPVPEIRWKLDTAPLNTTRRTIISHSLDSEGNTVGSLKLKSTTVEDGGVYSCIATNVKGTVQHSARLNIHGPLGARKMPGRVSIVSGEDVALFCPVYGYPISKVTWEKDSISLPGSLRQTVHENGSLHIEQVQKKVDSGEYVCQATNENGQSAKGTLSVQVMVAPKITPFAFQEDLLREGMRARIHCVVSEGDSPLSIKWTKDEKPLLRSGMRDDSVVQSVDEYSSVLSIRSVAPRHNGNYTCVVINAAGTAAHSARLFVNALPKIIPFTFQDDQNFKGMRAHIICAVSQGDLPLTFRWLKDGREIQSSLGANVGSYDRHSSSLSIESVSSKHSGNYSCVVSNEAGEARFTAQLMVQVGPRIDTLSLQDKWVQEGINVGITCILAEGDPPIVFYWTKDGQPASSLSGVHVVTPNEFTSVLTISGTTMAHSGNYSCVTANPVAVSAHTAKLNVNVAPRVVPFSFQGDHMVEGVLARVSCVVYQGDLPISLEWLRDGLPISRATDDGLSIRDVDDYTSILTIDNVVSKHSGNYSCVAKNSAAAVSHTAQLVVKVPPKIVPFSFQDDQLVEGMFVRVSCVVSRGDLPLSIAWTKDGQRISPDLGAVVRKLDDYSSVLSIDSVASHHTGNYTCLAKNAAASAVYSASLSVYVPPYWVKTPERKVKARNGHSLLLDCQADGFPKPTIAWARAKGSKFIDPVQEKDGFLLHRNGSLFITSVTEAHSGSYSCKASNGIGVGLDIIVVVEVQNAAKIISNFGNLTVVRGKSLTLRCTAAGDKPLAVQWSVNGKSVDVGTSKQSRIQVNETISEGKTVSELTITKAEKADNAIFLCSAQNSLGNDESQTHVLVQGPPDAPFAVKVIDKGSRSVEVDWSPPFDGNSPIEKYIVAYQPHGSGDVTMTATVLRHVTHTFIYDLKPSTMYKFTVYAENMVGRSETGGVAELSLAGEVPSGSPENVKAISVDANTLKVSWEPPEKHSWNGNIRGYHVGHRIAGSGDAFEYQLLEVPEGYDKGLSFTIDELNELTQYGVVVQAFNDQGKGPLSVEVLAMTSEGVPNESPQRIQCSTVSSQSILVSWLPLSSEAVSGILRGYRILFWPIARHMSDGEWKLNVFNVTSSTTKVTLSGLSQFTNYSMQVLGFTLVGDGLASKPVHCKTSQEAPSSPDEVKVLQSTADSMVVVWKAPKNSNGLVTHYTVRVNGPTKEQELRYSVHGNLTSYEIRGLQRNKRYKFVISATSKVGEGQLSSPVYATLLAQLKVGAKCTTFGQMFHVNVGQSVNLPCHTVGVPAPLPSWFFGDQELAGSNKMMVGVKGGGSLRIETVQSSDSGNYTCRVANDAGRDQVTHVLIVTALPSPPSLLVSSSSATAVGLFWKPSSDGNSPILNFVVNYKAEFGSWQSVELQPYFVSFQLTGLLCGTTYQMYITAVNEVGASPPSDTVTVTTNGGVPTVPILSKLVKESTTHAVLHLDTWVANGCPILYFAIEYKPKTSRSWLLVSSDVHPEKRKLLLDDLNPGSWYNLRMRAHTSAGSSVAEYEFSTLSVNEGTLSKDDFIEDVDLFGALNVHIALPTAVCGVVVLFCIIVTYFWVKKKKQTGGSERVAAMDVTPSKGRPPASNPKKGGKTGKRSSSAADISNLRRHQHHQGRPRTGSAGGRSGSDDDIAPYAMVKLSDVQRRETKDRQNYSLPRNTQPTSSTGMQAWQQPQKQMVPFSIQQAYNPSAPPMSDSYHGMVQSGLPHQRNASYINSQREKVRLLREDAVITAAPVVKYPTIPTEDEPMETTFLFPPPPDDLRDGDYDPPPPEMNWLPTA